jgi:DNA-binding NarL/FixJ family response regulator
MNVLHKKYKNHSWCNLVIRPDAQNSTQLDPDEFLPEKLHFYVGEKERYITQKELLCALHLIRGFNNREIAKALQISVRTVEKHMDALRTKISVTNRQQLIEFFLKLGLYRL